jgi:hypothetical protein
MTASWANTLEVSMLVELFKDLCFLLMLDHSFSFEVWYQVSAVSVSDILVFILYVSHVCLS